MSYREAIREETWEGIRDAFNVREKELRKGLDWQASCREPEPCERLPQGTLPGEKVHSPVGHGCLLGGISESTTRFPCPQWKFRKCASVENIDRATDWKSLKLSELNERY